MGWTTLLREWATAGSRKMANNSSDNTLIRVIAKAMATRLGEVYRAKDTKLSREVAIKVLPEALMQDPERLARFQREAWATSP